MAEPVVSTWNDIIARPTKGSVTSRAAHKVLDNFRSDASGPVVDVPGGRQQVSVKDDMQSLDLTDGYHFDWWGYLANHPDGQKVVGQGVTKFELMFLEAVDPNHKQRRLDFIVTRVTTVADPHRHVRLHPHENPITHNGGPSRKEAFPVYGSLPEWLGQCVPGVNCGEPSPDGLTRDRAEHAAPQQDVIGRNEAWEFIQKLNQDEEEWYWCVDLTDGAAFKWHRYLMSNLSFKELLDIGITHFCAVWDGENPDRKTYAFVASTANDEQSWTIRPTYKREELTQGAPYNWECRPWKQRQ